MKKETQSSIQIHGIKMHNINRIMIIMTCIIYMIILFLTVKLYQNYADLTLATQNYINGQDAAQQLRDGSDYMSEQVRLYAETGDLRYVENYFTEANTNRRRDLALEQLLKMGMNDDLEEELRSALNLSNELMSIEYHAMRLTAESYQSDISLLPDVIQNVTLTPEELHLTLEEKEIKGRNLVFNETYRSYKRNIYLHLSTLVDEILQQTQLHIEENSIALSNSLGKQRVMITTLLLLNILMFIFIIKLVINPLHSHIKHIQNDQQFDIVGSYELKYLASTYNDIYKLNASRKENLIYSAEHDQLTGVLNRTAFENITLTLKDIPVPLALLIIDVDFFKNVNDTFGHDTGDAVLQKIAKLFQNETRSSDNIIRYGGDEFIVLMTNMAFENASIITKKIAHINDILLHPDDGLPAVSVSVGVAFSQNGYNEELLKKADESLYSVKKKSRGHCEITK